VYCTIQQLDERLTALQRAYTSVQRKGKGREIEGKPPKKQRNGSRNDVATFLAHLYLHLILVRTNVATKHLLQSRYRQIHEAEQKSQHDCALCEHERKREGFRDQRRPCKGTKNTERSQSEDLKPVQEELCSRKGCQVSRLQNRPSHPEQDGP
jgi:hypothetical protein